MRTYPHKHSGQAAIICGTAPCLHEEFDIARNALPEAKVIAVNDAASVIESDFIASVHEEKLAYFKGKSLNKDAITITEDPYNEALDVDYWFTPGAKCSRKATSTGAAIDMALQMGFDEIVIVGAPMDGGDGYVDYPGMDVGVPHCPRFGYSQQERGKNLPFVAVHQRALRQMTEELDCSAVSSMSGFSRDVFGGFNDN